MFPFVKPFGDRLLKHHRFSNGPIQRIHSRSKAGQKATFKDI